MSFYISRGFASLNYDDNIARMTYIEQLPMISECLSFQHFYEEFEKVLKSIAQFPPMVYKMKEMFPFILQHLDREQCYQTIYLAGEKLCISSDDKSKKAFLEIAEQILQEMNDIPHEYEKYLKPQLLPKIGLELTVLGKFALWRLARLTVISKDYLLFEDLIFHLFTDDHLIGGASDALSIMHPILAKKYLIKALMSPNDSARIAAINAIEAHNIDTHDEFIEVSFAGEHCTNVLKRISMLPIEKLSKNVIEILMKDDNVAKEAASVALASPHFPELLPCLKSRGGVGCEMNKINFSYLKKCQPIPYDFLSLLMKESKEILTDETIDSILTLDTTQITVKLVFPRMNERGSWRSRYNAILLSSKMLERSKNNVHPIDQGQIMNFAGFIVAMGLDLVYAVREAAFKSVEFFPESSAVSIFESLISIVSTTDDFQKLILREFLKAAKKPIALYCDRKKIEAAFKAIDFNDPSYFDVSK